MLPGVSYVRAATMQMHVSERRQFTILVRRYGTTHEMSASFCQAVSLPGDILPRAAEWRGWGHHGDACAGCRLTTFGARYLVAAKTVSGHIRSGFQK